MAAVGTTITLAQDPQEPFWIKKDSGRFQHVDPSLGTDESGSDDDGHRGIGFTAPDMKGAHTQEFAKTAPRWRIIRPGLNLEAKCNNEACATAETAGQVWLNCGIGEFKIGREVSTSSCPECKQDFSDKDFIRFGFWQCRFVAKGFQTAPEKGEFSLEDTADKTNGFMKFSQGQATWAYLDITTKPLDATAEAGESSCIIV